MISFFVEPITQDTIAECARFLIAHENTCVSLMNYFVKDGIIQIPKNGSAFAVFFWSTTERQVKKICAVLFQDHLLFHCVDSAIFDAICPNNENETLRENLFTESIRPFIKKTFGIIGHAFGTNLIKKIILQPIKLERDYDLFEYNPLKSISFSHLDVSNSEFIVRQCTVDDIGQLYPLQKQYEIEEVLLPGSRVNELVCFTNLQKKLKEQIVFAVFDSMGRAVAKAGTNARGMFWDQLGGVFTDHEFRARGFACMLTHHLAEFLSKNERKITLFVNKTNISAQHAYIRAGFVRCDSFKIVYY